MRYINRPPHKYSCVPTAIMNSIKWLGSKIDYTTYIDLFKTLGYSHEKGVQVPDIARMLKFFKINYEQPTSFSLLQLEEELKRGNSAILVFYTATYGHATFIHGVTPQYFKCTNVNEKNQYRKTGRVSKRKMFNYLASGNFFGYLYIIPK